jgi:hypothetical protein
VTYNASQKRREVDILVVDEPAPRGRTAPLSVVALRFDSGRDRDSARPRVAAHCRPGDKLTKHGATDLLVIIAATDAASAAAIARRLANAASGSIGHLPAVGSATGTADEPVSTLVRRAFEVRSDP